MTSTEAETIAHLRERIAALEADKENLRVEWERLRDRELSLEAENERLRVRIREYETDGGTLEKP